MFPMPSAGVTPAALCIKDAARYISCGQTKLYEMIKAGRITARKLGRKTVIPVESLDAFLARLPAKPVIGGAA